MEQPVTLLTRLRHSRYRRSGKTESLAGAAGTMASSVSRFNTDRLLVVGIFEISRDLSCPSSLPELKGRCAESILHTSGRVALYRCWICHSPGMSSPVVVVMWCNKVVKVFCSLCMHCFFDLRTSAPTTG
ncbi:hypothetical protein TNCV_4085851 [Trichonephila clavipes]|nr:hypothetical protein TNCV_4085851 [Trichonephila clavipes]